MLKMRGSLYYLPIAARRRKEEGPNGSDQPEQQLQLRLNQARGLKDDGPYAPYAPYAPYRA